MVPPGNIALLAHLQQPVTTTCRLLRFDMTQSTEEQRALLTLLGCDTQQGYLLGRPMTGDQLLAHCCAEVAIPDSVSALTCPLSAPITHSPIAPCLGSG